MSEIRGNICASDVTQMKPKAKEPIKTKSLNNLWSSFVKIQDKLKESENKTSLLILLIKQVQLTMRTSNQ